MNTKIDASTKRVSSLDALLSLSGNAPKVTEKARIRTAKIEFLDFTEKEYDGGGLKQTILSLVQYQDDKTKKWRERKSDLKYSEARLLREFISQEKELGLPVFDGTTLYKVKCEINKKGFSQWTSIERLEKEINH
ncbi:MAG: hypothetical protein QNK36_21050 [Colwellia sp.]|nr:hypothetical protein [Colwellia sp.]